MDQGAMSRRTRQINRRGDRNKQNKERRQKEMKGRILKIKTGYNPNSSSIGVDTVVFFTAGAALTILFNTLVAVVSAAKTGDEGRREVLEETSVLGRGNEKG